MSSSTIQLITGRLAEKGLRRLAGDLAQNLGQTFEVVVLPINVISLATVDWIARHHKPPHGVQKVILPGLCRGDIDILRGKWGVEIHRGPEDFRDLPEFFRVGAKTISLNRQNIEILAEINLAPRLDREELMAQAKNWIDQGADRIDLGSEPGVRWIHVGDRVKELLDQGIKVSIDSFDTWEVTEAIRAGADLVLSVNRSNREQARDWGAEVVAIPDQATDLASLFDTAQFLEKAGVCHRLDPILEPIGHGFGASILRYSATRKEFPNSPMLMGVGNLTELTEVDSAGVNFLLLALCQEWGIGSILTTEVATWCRSSVREIDRIRRVLFYAINEGVIPKRLDPSLVLLREGKKRVKDDTTIDEIAASLQDRNIRIFAENGSIEAMNGHFRIKGTDPFEIFDQISKQESLEPSHAFYLGFEMAKAVTALTLDKTYRQDAALNWGFLTRPEESHLARRKERESINTMESILNQEPAREGGSI